MSESFQDQLARVRMMADPKQADDMGWDFSDNDHAALQAVLARLAKLEAERTVK